MLGRTANGWVEPLPAPAPLPRHLRGLIEMLAEYQVLAAEAAWSGTRRDAVRALAANPLVLSLDKAEGIYDELADAHRALPPGAPAEVSGRLLLGVDGGNTKTVALIARDDGTIVGAGRAGCSDHYGETTPSAAYEEIASSVRAALAAAAQMRRDIAGACFSLAGADWPEDIAVYERELAARLQLPIQAVVVNDAIGALRAGTSDGVGVAVACGTGTAIGARAHDGRVWHVSHWGLPSYRFSLARGAIEAAVQAELGIEPPTLLQELVPASAGHRSVEELLRAMSMLGVTRPPLGHTAIALLDADVRGDATAHRVIGEVARRDRRRGSRIGCTRGPGSPLAGGARGRAVPPHE